MELKENGNLKRMKFSTYKKRFSHSKNYNVKIILIYLNHLFKSNANELIGLLIHAQGCYITKF